MRDLRTWLKQVNAMGELLTIAEELDWDEETSALNYIVGQREGAPALLYEKVKDAPAGFRCLHNLFGTSKERIAAALDLPLNTVRSRLHRARMDLKEKLERFLP